MERYVLLDDDRSEIVVGQVKPVYSCTLDIYGLAELTLVTALWVSEMTPSQ